MKNGIEHKKDTNYRIRKNTNVNVNAHAGYWVEWYANGEWEQVEHYDWLHNARDRVKVEIAFEEMNQSGLLLPQSGQKG